MGDPVITGTKGAIVKPTIVKYDPVRGLSMSVNYEGAGSSAAVGYFNYFMGQGIACEAVVSEHTSTLHAELTAGGNGFPDTVQDHWQLMANEVQKDIKEHPLVVQMESDNPGSLAAVLAAVEQFNGGTTTPPTFSTGDPTATNLFNYMKHGGTHWAEGQYVLKWQTTVSFSSFAYRSEGARELLYSTSQVLAESDPPSRIASQMTSITPNNAVDGYYWSWRRVPSTMTTVAGNRIEIATEYWLDQWSTFVYGVA